MPIPPLIWSTPRRQRTGHCRGLDAAKRHLYPDGTTPFEAFILETNSGAANATVSFMVDNFSVAGEVVPSSSSSSSSSTSSSGGVSNLASNGTVETDTSGWAAMRASIERSTADKHSGEASLLVSNRGDFWQGATYPLSNMVTGKTYQVSAWIKLAPAKPPKQ